MWHQPNNALIGVDHSVDILCSRQAGHEHGANDGVTESVRRWRIGFLDVSHYILHLGRSLIERPGSRGTCDARQQDKRAENDMERMSQCISSVDQSSSPGPNFEVDTQLGARKCATRLPKCDSLYEEELWCRRSIHEAVFGGRFAVPGADARLTPSN